MPRISTSLFLALFLTLPFATSAFADDHENCRANRGDAAMAACNRILNSDKSNREQIGSAFINRGQQHYENQDYDRAIEDFTAAIALKPKWLQLAYGNRGNCYYAKGDNQAAIENYTKALNINAEYPAALTARGLLYEKAGEFKKARANYEAALEAKSRYADDKWAHDTARASLKKLNGG